MVMHDYEGPASPMLRTKGESGVLFVSSAQQMTRQQNVNQPPALLEHEKAGGVNDYNPCPKIAPI